MKWILYILTLIAFTFSLLKVNSLAHIWHYTPPNNGAFIEIDHFKVFYRQIGHGPDLVLVHGIGASQRIWQKVEEPLKSHFRLTLLDLPGFGRSSRHPQANFGTESQLALLKKTLDRLQLTKVTLVGSSMGGALSLWMALKYPERVDRLILLAPATDPRLVPLPFYQFSGLAKFLYFFTNRLTLWMSFNSVVADKSNINDERLMSSLFNHEAFGSDSLQVVFKATELLSDKRMPEVFRRVKNKTLLLHGTLDPMVPSKFIDKLEGLLPDVKRFSNPKAGHHIMEDDPQWVSEKILDFML